MSSVDVLAIAPHPDDAEMGCGGTLALMAAMGKRTAILNLTRGELGTRGSEERRRKEAEAARLALSVDELDFLDFGDGGMRTGRDEEDQLIVAIRRFRPTVVLAPPHRDRHPDHERANSLVRSACFYAGLEKRSCPGDLLPHRPPLLIEYMLHSSFEPTLVIDVTRVWEKKLLALEAYSSQLTSPRTEASEPPSSESATKVGSSEFFASLIGRAQSYGQMVGAEFGEPFFSERPLAVRDPFDLVPRGMV